MSRKDIERIGWKISMKEANDRLLDDFTDSWYDEIPLETLGRVKWITSSRFSRSRDPDIKRNHAKILALIAPLNATNLSYPRAILLLINNIEETDLYTLESFIY